MDRVGIAIIAKNEEEQLPRLLESISGAFDRAVLLDTGSTDNTIDVFAGWAKNQSGMTFSVASWEWNDDFADARNAADRLLLFGTARTDAHTTDAPMVDWRSWADCDDLVVGAQNLRGVANNADPQITAFFAGYNYAQDEHGQCVIYLQRERLVRASYTQEWIGRVHEATPISSGAVMSIPSDMAEWVHHKQGGEASNDRNLRILEKWNEDTPGDPRIVGYLGVENMVRGELENAVRYFCEYKTLNSSWGEEHAQMCRKLAQCYMMTERPALALQQGFDGMVVQPEWTDNYLTLAEACYFLGDYDKSLFWAQQAEQFGKPSTLLIINPLDYSYLPKKLQALALGDSGRLDEALTVGNQALQLSPVDQFLQMKMREWQGVAKREHTANTICMMAEQLVAHDEQLKAMALLEDCVPHFAIDHPRVVGARAQVRERLRWANKPGDYAEHYETGGSKPEDFIPEENIDKLCEYLPRTNFLLEGLKEQSAA